MDSTFKVPYTVIKEIKPHPGADRLELAFVYGFQVVVRKDQYKVGDKVVYAPIDSVIQNAKLENHLFPIDVKVKLNNSRIRQIRLRGLASQGMLIDPKEVSDWVLEDDLILENDLAESLGIVKYEPPEKGPAQTVGKGGHRNKKEDHPQFHKFNGLGNVKWFPELFQEGEQVCIQEKLHGTHARAGKLPYVANTLWKKLKKFLHLAPEFENVYGSNNVEISSRSNYVGYYGEDLYGKAFDKIRAFDKIPNGHAIYGEVIGPDIQKNYTYGLEEQRFILFDVKYLKEDGSLGWLSPEQVEAFAIEHCFEYVPVLYKGPFNKELATSLSSGPSAYCPSQKVREGVVIKSLEQYDVDGNKKALKLINEEYLDDKTNTDNHQGDSMGKFKVSSVINLEEVSEGQEFAESDFAAQTPSGKFVQMKYIDEDEKKLEPYKVKAGVWSIEKTSMGLILNSTEMIQDKILESFVNTKEITDKVDCFFNKIDVYKQLGFDVAKRTILLYGPAGTGKSTAINKVVRNYTDSETAVLIWGTDKIESHLIKDFFKSFEYVGVKKVILVVEDIGGVEMEETRLRSDPSLLALLDNQEKAFKIPTLIMATTNHPEMFLGNLTNRPNRIDDKIEVGYPPAEARVELLAFFMGKKVDELDPTVRAAFLDKACANFSPAHIREVLIRSMIYDKSMVEVIKQMNNEVAQFNKAFAKTKELGISSRY